MSTASALAFLRAVREDEAVRRQVAALARQSALGELDELAACVEGFDFSNHELVDAFRMDWTARWLHHRATNDSA